MNDYPEDEVIDSYPDFNPEEAWVYSTMSDVEEIIKKHGVEFFINTLPRYSKIAILAYKRSHNANPG